MCSEVRAASYWPPPSIFPMLGTWLAGVRLGNGVPIEQFATYADVRPATVRSWELGRTKPRLLALRRLRDGMRMPSSVLEQALRCFGREP